LGSRRRCRCRNFSVPCSLTSRLVSRGFTSSCRRHSHGCDIGSVRTGAAGRTSRSHECVAPGVGRLSFARITLLTDLTSPKRPGLRLWVVFSLAADRGRITLYGSHVSDLTAASKFWMADHADRNSFSLCKIRMLKRCCLFRATGSLRAQSFYRIHRHSAPRWYASCHRASPNGRRSVMPTDLTPGRLAIRRTNSVRVRRFLCIRVHCEWRRDCSVARWSGCIPVSTWSKR